MCRDSQDYWQDMGLCGSCGLWGGSHRVDGARVWCLLLLVLTGGVEWVQSHPSPDGALELLWH